jgi:alpha-beta hydrolase superfamily lysophospholipase
MRLWVDKAGGGAPKAVLLCIHGLGLNGDSYKDFAARVAPKGIKIYTMDVRGFGEWQKEKGHTKIDFNQAVEDCASVLRFIRKDNPNLLLFLLGESMGGALVLRTTALHGDLMDGTISSVPANDRFQQKMTDVKVALHALEGLKKPFDEGKQVIDQATKSPALREGWASDPLDRMDFSPEDLLQFQLFCNENHESAKEITKTPICVFQGGSDKLIKPDGTVHLFSNITVKDKILIVLGYSQHLMFEETQYANPTQAIDHLMTWINDHMPASNSKTAGQ